MSALGHTISQGRYVVPSTFTVGSMVCAIASMQNPNPPAEPAWWIMYSVLLDKLDGTAARLLRAQTRWGVHLDSLADLLALGVAPAHLFYRIMSDGPIVFTGSETVWAAIALLYALATGWRLRRFTLEAGTTQSRCFRGMTSTMSGAMFATFVAAFFPTAEAAVYASLVAMLAGLSIAMNLRYRSRKVTIPRRKTLLLVQSAFVAFVYHATLTRTHPQILFAASLVVLAISITGVDPEADGEDPAVSAGSTRSSDG
jgi:CDP-diacylglycerol--serine O-phosphatidyltransferase